MNISSLKYHPSVIQKQKTVLPRVNFMRGERGYGRWDLMMTFLNILAFWRFLSSVHRLHSTLLRRLLPNLPCLAHFDSSLKSVLFVFPLMFQPVMSIYVNFLYLFLQFFGYLFYKRIRYLKREFRVARENLSLFPVKLYLGALASVPRAPM